MSAGIRKTEPTTEIPDDLVELAAHVISAYVIHHRIPVEDLTGLIAEVHVALGRAATGAAAPEPVLEPPKPVPNSPISRVCGSSASSAEPNDARPTLGHPR